MFGRLAVDLVGVTQPQQATQCLLVFCRNVDRCEMAATVEEMAAQRNSFRDSSRMNCPVPTDPQPAGEPGPPIPLPPINRTHDIPFTYHIVSEIIADIVPDSLVVLDSLESQLDYSIFIENMCDSASSIKYQIDYDYNDSNQIFLGPFEITLEPYSSLANKIPLSTFFTGADSIGLYNWNLRLFTLENDTIAVDSLRILKE